MERVKLGLEKLPWDILNHIFSFLSFQTRAFVLPKLCKRFAQRSFVVGHASSQPDLQLRFFKPFLLVSRADEEVIVWNVKSGKSVGVWNTSGEYDVNIRHQLIVFLYRRN